MLSVFLNLSCNIYKSYSSITLQFKNRQMKNLKLILAFYISCFIFNTSRAQETDINIENLTKEIDYEYFYKHLEYLASDELKGRNTGSDDYAKAADYVANEYQKLGLIPFGDHQTYFQRVEMNALKLNHKSVNFKIVNNKKVAEGIYGKKVTLLANRKYAKVNENQEIVFAGYGNILPEDSINDYEGLDVKGKTVIVVLGGPKGIKNNKVHDIFFKANNAIDQGATGLILFYPNLSILQNLIFNRIHGYISEEVFLLKDTSFSGSNLDLDLKIAGYTKKKYIKEIFKINDLKLKKALKKIEKREIYASNFKSNVQCKFEVAQENKDCKNVVALLPGTDPVLKNEYIVLSAHLDHVGVGKAIKGDSIYNGMWDNATGSAAVIAMAKAYANLNEKPKRSIIFVCYTGEEKGLLGSHYFANKNEVKNGKIVANVNIDMLGNLFETTDIIPLGYSHSSLSTAVDFAASALDIIIDDNKLEEDNYLMRSDQFSFLEKGVPALNIGSGYTALNPKIKAKKATDKWMKKYYHSPFDDLNQEISKDAFLTSMKVNFLTSFYISHELEEVKWNTDSWIYKEYVVKESIK
jgi:Peptidase family M28